MALRIMSDSKREHHVHKSTGGAFFYVKSALKAQERGQTSFTLTKRVNYCSSDRKIAVLETEVS